MHLNGFGCPACFTSFFGLALGFDTVGASMRSAGVVGWGYESKIQKRHADHVFDSWLFPGE